MEVCNCHTDLVHSAVLEENWKFLHTDLLHLFLCAHVAVLFLLLALLGCQIMGDLIRLVLSVGVLGLLVRIGLKDILRPRRIRII